MKKNVYFIILFLITLSVNSQSKKIEITYKKQSDNSIDFYYSKNVPGSYSLRLEFTRLENSSSAIIHEKVIKYSSGSLFSLQPISKNKGISFSYKISYILGNPKSKIKKDIKYRYQVTYKE